MRTPGIRIAVSTLALTIATMAMTSLWRSRLVHRTEGMTCPADAKTPRFDFILNDVYGRSVRLSDYKGRVLLLNFWATWCPPCKVEIPAFVNLYAKYRSQGFEVVGVVVQDPFSNVKPFTERYNVNYTVVDGNDREDLESTFGPVPALPTSVLINRDGKICSTHVGLPMLKGGGSLEKAVEEAFEAEIRLLL